MKSLHTLILTRLPQTPPTIQTTHLPPQATPTPRTRTDTTDLASQITPTPPTTRRARELAPSTAKASLIIHLVFPLMPRLSRRVDEVDDTKRRAAYAAENGEASHTPEDELEVEVGADVGAAVSLGHGHGENRVRYHPDDHHVGSHCAVVVFLGLLSGDALLRDFDAVTQVPQSLVVAGVNV